MTLYDFEDDPHSTTDASEDSVEVAVRPKLLTSAGRKNKRKSVEPKKRLLEAATAAKRAHEEGGLNVSSEEEEEEEGKSGGGSDKRGPAAVSPVSLKAAYLAPKKRFKLDAMLEMDRRVREEEEEEERAARRGQDGDAGRGRFLDGEAGSGGPPLEHPRPPYLPCLVPPFLGASAPPAGMSLLPVSSRLYNSLPQRVRDECMTLANLSLVPEDPPVQEEPLALVKRRSRSPEDGGRTPEAAKGKRAAFNIDALLAAPKSPERHQPQRASPQLRSPPAATTVTVSSTPLPQSPPPGRPRNDSGHSSSGQEDERGLLGAGLGKQRNYKNMTRERRVEANARERQRVHTITAAFDNLQAAIPTEDENTKLSKLSVIKVATAYIMALSRMAGYDYTEDQSAPPVSEVVEHCSRVIDEETRIKKRTATGCPAKS